MGKRDSFKAELRRRGKDVARVIDVVLPVVIKDPDWQSVIGDTGRSANKTYADQLRAITRVTKRAVKAMHPGYAVSVRRGRGTAYNWVYVDVTVPELEHRKVRGTPRELEYKDVCRRIKDVLLALCIKYATYESDDWRIGKCEPCLSVTVNRAM